MVGRLTLGGLVALIVGGSPARAQTTAANPAEALFTLVNRAGTFEVTDAVISLVGSEAATFPVNLAAGGFTWELKPGDIVQTRSSESFGPMFANRPLTGGIHKLMIGFSFQHTSFATIDGQSLSDLHTSGIPSLGDRTTLSLSVAIDRSVVSATYGVTPRVDLGIVVPFGRTSVNGSHSGFLAGRPSAGASADVSSWGIGDVSVVSKVRLPSVRLVDVAAAVELRLPTGDKKMLLGTGTTQTEVMMVGAINKRVSPHFNIGYVFGGSGFEPFAAGAISLERILDRVQPSPEFDYTVGADAAVTPRITVAGDVIGRSLRKGAQVTLVTDPTFSKFSASAGVVNLLLGALSTKILIGDSWLLTGSVLFPLNDHGLVPNATPVVGFERAF